MIKLILTFLIFMPAVSHAFFNLLAGNQCQYPQTQFPTNQNDYNHANTVRVQELERYRSQLDRQMAQVSSESYQMQAAVRAYFNSPWSETMFQHMDNGLDCCAPTAAVAMVEDNNQRMPAGNGLVEPEYYDTVQTPPAAEPEYVNPEATAPAKDYTCNGYSSQYCSQDWGKPYEDPTTSGRSCLQTGFASTPAWYYKACRPNGEINPQACADPRISKAPQHYQRCVGALDLYRRMAAQKKHLASQIADINLQIQNIKYPNRPNTNDAYTGEVTTANKGTGFLAGLGNFLGGVISTVGPFVLDQYLSYKMQKQTANQPRHYGPRQVLAPPGARPRQPYNPMMRPHDRSGTLGAPQYARQPTYYGPNYGYGFGNNNQYGQTPPGFNQGAFGCSQGTLGAGAMLSSLLSGQTQTNSNTGFLGNLLGGLLGGGANLNASLNLGPSHPQYQPGGLYGTTPTYRPTDLPAGRNNTRFIMAPPNQNTCQYCVPQNNTRNRYLSPEYDSFYYAQQREQERLRYQMAQMNANGYTSMSVNSNSLDLNSLLSQMFMPSAGINGQLYFNAGAGINGY